MNSEQFEIIEAFSSGFDVELTINQISKLINKSYAFTNKYTHELIESQILDKKAVGSALLCTLNLRNEETLGCLAYNSHRKKRLFREAHPEMFDKCQKKLEEASADCSEIAFIQKGRVTLVTDRNIGEDSITVLGHKAFRESLERLAIKEIILVKGHEAFWKYFAEVRK